jgi:hypothetical protein
MTMQKGTAQIDKFLQTAVTNKWQSFQGTINKHLRVTSLAVPSALSIWMLSCIVQRFATFRLLETQQHNASYKHQLQHVAHR